jgi:hypothetical protein
VSFPLRRICTPMVAALAALQATPAAAHVKWFAPYIVDAPPAPVSDTLTNLWFWTAIVLVLAFFVATRVVEQQRIGATILAGFDKVSAPLWNRLDDFVRCVIGAFFVAIFAVGGVYLTPDLKTPAEWVSWLQLFIAFGVFSRRTMPFSAAGIIVLWVLALRDYDLFHLLDYLALGVAVALYLVLASSKNESWRKHRFEVLRWGVAIALMWSSLEKFAYPEWFYPLVLEKPFLTFGMPRDVFIPMAGVAEFTMGFGLLGTPLVRRLSALALFVIFNAAVWPFGRIDLIGHALIMAIIVAIAVDPTKELHFIPFIRNRAAMVPVGLAGALLLFGGSYWGLHMALYGIQERPAVTDFTTHTFDPERPHDAPAASTDHAGHGMAAPAAGEVAAAYAATMDAMHGPMLTGLAHPDPDAAFVLGMIPHHQGAIEMSNVVLKYGSDAEVRALAEHIIAAQQPEIAQMNAWLAAKGITAP